MKSIRGAVLPSRMKHFAVLLFGVLGLPMLPQSPGAVTRMHWPNAYGGPYEVYYQAVPTSLTDLDRRDSRLIVYYISNSTAGALTFTIQTKDASPLPLPLTG